MTKRMKEFKERLRENARKEKEVPTYDLEAETSVIQVTEDDLWKCEKFLKGLQKILEGKYEIIGSCNRDISRYLIPVGTENQVTYYRKPDFSFRISDHWNWYSNLKKCSDENYIQCNSVDMPEARKRTEDGKATKPRKGLQVAIQGTDGKYHHVFGYKWDRKTKSFRWVENSPADICRIYGLA